MPHDTPQVAVILSGCGVFDGAEIHESVLTLLALNRRGAEAHCFAPDIAQAHVVNHLTGEEAAGESRNVLVESARIARGAIADLAQLKAADIDAVIFPGGFGAAKNLCSFAFDGPDCTVTPEVARIVAETVAAQKPLAALCIAPAMIAKLLDDAEVTIGSDAATAQAIEAMGARHSETGHGGVIIDRRHRLVTAPCYMLDSTVAQIADGADAAVAALLDLVAESRVAAQ